MRPLAIRARVSPEFAAFLPHAVSGCSAERLERARVFFTQPEHSPPGTDLHLARVSEETADCVGLRQREGEVVRAYLLGLVAGEAK